SRLNRYQVMMGYLFISPAMLLFLIFALVPAVIALVLSFSNYDILSPIKWVGLNNYSRLLSDDLFFTSLRNIVYYAVLFIPLMIACSLGLALALNRKVPGMKVFRVIYYFPMVTSSVAASTVWVWLLNRDYGVINQLLGLVGINGPAWLSNSDTAMFAVVFVTLWQGLGGNMIVYLAGLQGIPEYLYEAAVLDGAGPIELFSHITWPSLRNTTFFVVTLSLIGSFQLFDQAYVMTQGGPGHATLTPVYNIYNAGFNRLQMGYASAQAFVLFLIILAVSLINTRINRQQNMV
ncbi:MAG TPA: sugar ABC transporter permease, partial [Chloroflexia bacterium]|nr:sugar ABC transporter permease [Chloroflexia bacterium]